MQFMGKISVFHAIYGCKFAFFDQSVDKICIFYAIHGLRGLLLKFTFSCSPLSKLTFSAHFFMEFSIFRMVLSQNLHFCAVICLNECFLHVSLLKFPFSHNLLYYFFHYPFMKFALFMTLQ